MIPPHTCPACGHVLDHFRAFSAEWMRYTVHLWGANWALCRSTPRTRARYSRCVKQSEYAQAERDFIAGARAP